jgi:hypothetical protein
LTPRPHELELMAYEFRFYIINLMLRRGNPRKFCQFAK